MNLQKIGDTFLVYAQFQDADTKCRGVKIPTDTEELSINADIVNHRQKIIANCKTEIMDQNKFPGFIKVTVPANETAKWDECHANLDLKLKSGNFVLKSVNIDFIIRMGQTS